jgi:PIN domain nuclease of toxin-antitoxin system
MIYVMDSTAMIAFLNGEPGADVVENYLLDMGSTSLAHAINVCEVYYQAFRQSGDLAAKKTLEKIADIGIRTVEDFDESLWREAGRLKAIYRKVSLADCLGLALTIRVGGRFITSDHHELDPLAAAGVCQIDFFR